MRTNAIKFVSLSQNTYNNLENKTSFTIYFTTDTCRIYRGDVLYASDIQLIDNVKVSQFLAQNSTSEGCLATTHKLYIDTTTGSMYVNIVGEDKAHFTQIGISSDVKDRLLYLTQITKDDANKVVTVSEDGSKYVYTNTIVNVIASSASENNIPTEKAVRDLIGGGATADTPILVEENGQWKLNKAFNPGVDIYFNNGVIEYGATKVNFAGTVTSTKTADGEVKIQIGDNMNSSVYNFDGITNNDGKTNTKVTDVSTNIGLLNGVSVDATKNQSVTFTPAGYVHFDAGNNDWQVVVQVDGQQFATATVRDTLTLDEQGIPIWEDGIITTNNTGISTTITDKARQDNYPAAVGGRAKRSFTFNFATMQITPCKPIVITITGCGGTFTSKTFYYITGVTPSIAEATLNIKNESTVWYSGVEYYGRGTTFDFSAGDISDLNNQLQLNTTNNKLTFSATNCSSPSSIKGGNYSSDSGLINATSAQNNVCTYTKTGLTINDDINDTNEVSVSVTPINYYGSGTSIKATLTTSKPINTYVGNSTETKENFTSENMRCITSAVTNNSVDYTASGVKFVGNVALASNELLVVPGTGLQYTGTSETRYFTRKFIKAGSLTGTTITFVFGKGNLSNVSVELMKGENEWVSVNKYDGTAYSYATADSTNTKLVLSFTDSNANGGYFLRIGMKDSQAIIESITMA